MTVHLVSGSGQNNTRRTAQYCKLKNWRRIATRYDRHAQNYLSALALASKKDRHNLEGLGAGFLRSHFDWASDASWLCPA